MGDVNYNALDGKFVCSFRVKQYLWKMIRDNYLREQDKFFQLNWLKWVFASLNNDLEPIGQRQNCSIIISGKNSK